ncbi:hypothetical protein Back11_05250 [Paenibacillus baekrokdamisoli]|uniref:Uncharacterized protein n=1 Tax=Paenibacillus baekrokdamisoli TaxID=1712516 RepID=A0A3G9IJU8_9BACL|nr:hypothetical protein [Paenibacillus baekrokdamisoli]MBB3067633.1 hypothetical protein [Paenibacillus baekrokdamisoli]BBH19180.1 hypothetical protein Back11_05250 [Paenibacillus baekrokdamisoli]
MSQSQKDKSLKYAKNPNFAEDVVKKREQNAQQIIPGVKGRNKTF